jgi:dipeptidyl aminopeptidase/acylaminoacyl peptidase
MMIKRTLAAVAALAFLAGIAVPTGAAARAFTAQDLVMLNRVSDPQLSPDGQALVYTLRETDWDANRGRTSLWRLALGAPESQPDRLTAKGSNASSPRWSADGKWLYFLSDRSGSSQVWRLGTGPGEARQVTKLPVDVDNFMLAPDGRGLAVSLSVYIDCADLACTKKRLDGHANGKASGTVFDGLFIRHWDQWADGRRSQLFFVEPDANGAAATDARRLTQDISGDVPSKPFGGDEEYAFSADSRTLYFGVRIPGSKEPWSTNFDVYAVATDGSSAPRNLTAGNLAWDADPLPSRDGTKLYYLAMKRPGFESDRYGVMELDLASGKSREIDPEWDRSAGRLKLSVDGRTLYTTADDLGEHPLFAIDIASGKVKRVVAGGNVSDFSIAGQRLVFVRDNLQSPAQVYSLAANGEATALTDLNSARLKDVSFGDSERFEFKGWNGDTVHGYVVKPYGFEPGRKYPVAFLIHGGPQGSWVNDFHYRWNPQTYAGAGFAVVTIDFHGSTGYGQAFTDAISKHWGDRPLEDLQKGWAAALAKFPYLAGDNACALGASYGGYMINWIAGNWNAPESGPWKCLVSHDGDFDNRTMAYSTEEEWFTEWENGGTPWQNPENYERFNPVSFVGNWKVPMLVIHSALDFRIPVEQGIAAFTALQWRNVPSEFLYFPDENHWVLKPQNSLQWHRTVERWLRKWTGTEDSGTEGSGNGGPGTEASGAAQ